MSKKYRADIVSTFAKNMIVPFSLLDRPEEVDISSQGMADFNRYKYRHLSECYRGDSVSSEAEVISKISHALEPCLMSGKTPVLLLSDGKDSMSLAVGFAESGVCCETLTLLRRDDQDLKNYVESVTSKLGHKPHFITVDEVCDNFDREFFIAACAKMDVPVLDQGFLYFLFGIKLFFDNNKKCPSDYVVVDGLGNDEYFGYLPSKQQLLSYRLSRLGFWSLIPNFARSLRWYLRSPVESHGDLSALSCFYPIPGALDLNAYFSNVPHSSDALPFLDFRAFSRGAFHDHQCMMGKTRASAEALGARVYFPWLDAKLADYCFNLPVACKFDFSGLKNKLPLRILLQNRIEWKQEKRGVDLYFDLNFSDFTNNVLSGIVPIELLSYIDSNHLLPRYVKQRAYLELLNFCGYCVAAGMEEKEIVSLLVGESQ